MSTTSDVDKPRILVARKIFPEGLARLEPVFDIDYNEADAIDAPETLRRKLIGKAGAIVTGSETIDSAALAVAKDLKIVANMMVGFNNLNLKALSEAGVMATNTPDVLTETTADLAFGLLLSAARRMAESEHWLRAGQWQKWSLDQWMGNEVYGTTLGVLGMGRIGQAIARRALGFGMGILYYKRNRLPSSIEAQFQARYVEMHELLRTVDHLIIVVPYTPENHHLIGATELAMMKPTATLVNIARGGIVDDEALADALRNKVIAAAGLDVFEGEPRVHPELLRVPNVALTPHIGSASRATRYAMMHLAIDNLLAGLAGKTPPNLLNPAYRRFTASDQST